MSMRRVAMLVVVGLLAACGSDGDPESSGDGGEPPEESPANEEERDLDADQELAEGAVLAIADLPAGFEEEAEDEDDSDDELDQSLADCLGIDVAELNDSDDEPQASATFANEAGQEVSSEVVVFATEEEVQEDLELWKDPATQDCLLDAMSELLAGSEDEVDFGEVTMEELLVEDLGDDALGLGFTIPAIGATGERVIYLDMVFVQQGRTGISMGFTAFDAPFDEQLGSELATTVVDGVPADA
jgi:hypothetical protein